MRCRTTSEIAGPSYNSTLLDQWENRGTPIRSAVKVFWISQDTWLRGKGKVRQNELQSESCEIWLTDCLQHLCKCNGNVQIRSVSQPKGHRKHSADWNNWRHISSQKKFNHKPPPISYNMEQGKIRKLWFIPARLQCHHRIWFTNINLHFGCHSFLDLHNL